MISGDDSGIFRDKGLKYDFKIQTQHIFLLIAGNWAGIILANFSVPDIPIWA